MTRDGEALAAWGWDAGWARTWQDGRYPGEPGRVVAVDRGSMLVRRGSGPVRALPGRGTGETVTVGDFCAVVREADSGFHRIHARLPRRGVLARRAAGRATYAQELAANVDTALLVCGLDRDGGIRALERLLTIVYDGGAAPVVVLNKADLCEDLEGALSAAGMAAPGVPVVATNALESRGLETLAPFLRPGTTAVLLGPSGAGKSTLVNALCARRDAPSAELAPTGGVRPGDARGRHTTTRRRLYPLPEGGLLLDTPGLRELGAWLDADGLAETFPEIESVARTCRFADCRHDREPGCAVRDALLAGRLSPARFHRFLELGHEAEATRARRTQRGKMEAKRRGKELARTIRRFYRDRDGR